MKHKPCVLITDNVHPSMMLGLEQLGYHWDYNPTITLKEVKEIIGNYNGIIINSKIIVDKYFLDKATQLRFIGRLGSGLEIIDLEYAKQKDVAVFSAPEGNRNAVAEHALGMLLSLSNQLLQADREVREFIWEREARRGWELSDKTIGLIGFGHTGSQFAKKLSSLDMRILAYDKYKKGFANTYVEESTMDTIWTEADIVSLHLPLTTETKYLVNNKWLSQFKKNIVLINTSRGKIVDLEAILQALENKRLKGVCLDVFENEKPLTYTHTETNLYQRLYRFNNVVLSPHVAGWTIESKEKLTKVLLKKIKTIHNL